MDFSPSILENPPLLTPNITETLLNYKPFITPTVDMIHATNSDLSSLSNLSQTKTTFADESSASSSSLDDVSRIENDLKQGLQQTYRKPTISPFFSPNGVLEKSRPINAGEIPADVPSTAEVLDILSHDKSSLKDTNERETLPSNTSPSDPMGMTVSPKKRFIIRSQSRTEPTSPTPMDNDNSTDDSQSQSMVQQFQRAPENPLLPQKIEPIVQTEHHLDSVYPVHSTMTKPSMPLINNKRPFPQVLMTTPMTKSNSLVLPQAPITNEVSSSVTLMGNKRVKVASNSHSFHQNFVPTPAINNSDSALINYQGAPDDQRKQQIRDSNREAARRCRERRRQYIEQLEGNLEQHKNQIKQLTEKLSRAERENTQLRAILNEANIFQTRRSSNENTLDFSAILNSSNGTDGMTIQRNYTARSAH